MKNCYRNALALVGVIALPWIASQPATATTHIVPSPSYPTIQAGLNAAQTSDTVRVAQGTYAESLFWPFRNGIVLIGAGRESTIVNGNQIDPGLYMVFEGIDSTTVVRDLGIRNGGDAGITLDTASPLVESCAIESTANGPGIYCVDGTQARIRTCRISNNVGSGIRCESSPVEARENLITGNSATGVSSGHGGGISCYGSAAMLIGNTISGNSAGNGGGGISCLSSAPPTLTGNTIVCNSALNGGGVQCNWSSAILTGNTISDNSAMWSGGGIHFSACMDGPPTLTGNRICRNTASDDGGAIFLTYYSDAQLRWNTVTDNCAGDRGDGIYAETSNPSMSSCNIAHNGVGVYNSSAAPIPNIQGNWWGDPTGPWHIGLNPGGLGDSLSFYAWDALPWLMDASTTAPPIPPRHLRVVEDQPGSLTLTWDAVPLGDLAGYRIYFDADSTGFPYSRSVDAGASTEITLPGLPPDSTYYIAVTCYDQGGEDSWFSREITVLPQPLATGSCCLLTGECSVTTQSACSGVWTLGGECDPNSCPASSVGDAGLSPITTLHAAPNPFTGSTTLHLVGPPATAAQVLIFDAAGRLVRTAWEGSLDGREVTITWDGTDQSGHEAPAGIYLLRVESTGGDAMGRLVKTR